MAKFEESLKQLENIVLQLERGDLALERLWIAGTSPMAVPSSSTSVGTTRRGLMAA